MDVVDVFENIAASTWQRICLGAKYKVSQGEETITDTNLLELAKANCSEVRVIKTRKDKEEEKGTDWEWWIGNFRLGWLRYAVQAKKLDPNNYQYKVLGHKVNKVKGIRQIEILEKYARANSAIPLYCFYNYLDDSRLSKFWHCNLFYKVDQLGCTVTPSLHVRKALSIRGKRTFEFLHSFNDTKPWRCLVRCPLMLEVYQTGSVSSTSLNFENVTVYPELPSEFSTAVETGFLEEFSSDFYTRDLGIYPKRILVTKYKGEGEAEENQCFARETQV